MSIEGVLFDVDGTLVDTTYLHAVSWSEALAQQGYVVTTARIHRGIGMGTGELLDELLGPDRPEGLDEAASAGHQVLYRAHFGHLRPLVGANGLLRWCQDQGIRTVLASAASKEELNALTDALEAGDAITAATSADDVEASKPNPDIVHGALEQLGLSPDRCVFVGDAVWDALAADAAEVSFIGLTCGGTGEAELRAAGAAEVWRDPQDLLDNVSTSLLGADRCAT
jgi:phosphoglycolate phosphatase-like HAD superfamily hydrolase